MDDRRNKNCLMLLLSYYVEKRSEIEERRISINIAADESREEDWKRGSYSSYQDQQNSNNRLTTPQQGGF